MRHHQPTHFHCSSLPRITPSSQRYPTSLGLFSHLIVSTPVIAAPSPRLYNDQEMHIPAQMSRTLPWRPLVVRRLLLLLIGAIVLSTIAFGRGVVPMPPHRLVDTMSGIKFTNGVLPNTGCNAAADVIPVC